jgi:signal transduction histidine kinase/ActR/RegA family two-component response regulator
MLTDHFVQFYENDAFLADSVATFIGGAIAAGHGAVIIVTPEHRRAIFDVMTSRGISCSGAIDRGDCVALDAAETLATFMVDGSPVPRLFRENVGGLIARLTRQDRPVRAFGEMVALLAADGNRGAAIELEDLWNELGKEFNFSLFCAYPISEFAGEGDAAPFSRICGRHAQVLPTESFSGFRDETDRSLAVTLLQQKAVMLEQEIERRRSAEHELAQRERELSEVVRQERMARAEAERVSRMKDEFLATLSHELRTPLNAIFGWTQVIRMAPLDAESVAKGIAVIDRNVRAQTQLIEDLLDMSRIVAGKLRLAFQQTELIPVLEAAVEAIRPLAAAKRVEIRAVFDPLAGPVRADASRLQQIVWNLLANSVKFTPAGGTIEVLLERVNSNAEISVTDTGQGIAPDFLPHVFEQFRQEDGRIVRRHGGLGLGLSIVKQLVDLHGGEVRAKSAGEGLGSTFVVALPIVAAKQHHNARMPAGATDEFSIDFASSALKGVRVLVVDDNADARELVARLLSEYEADVRVATSAADAFEQLAGFRPKVLVSDIGMPGKDGLEFIGEVRQLACPELRAIPALALTAFARSEDRNRAMLAGFQLHVTKPIEPRELGVAVASLALRAPSGSLEPTSPRVSVEQPTRPELLRN